MDSTSDLIIDSLKEEPIGETDHFIWFITDIGIAALFKRDQNYETYSSNVEIEANKIGLDITKEEKHDLELNAINELTKPIKRREKLIDLWHEYEKNITPEAKFVKACDKLDMALQATFYSLKDDSFNSKEFIDSALSKIDDECMRLLIDSTANGKN